MPILEKKIVIFGKMIVFTLDNNDALGGSRLGGAESNPKLQVNLNLNARLLRVLSCGVTGLCHLHFLKSKRVFILWLCNLAPIVLSV